MSVHQDYNRSRRIGAPRREAAPGKGMWLFEAAECELLVEGATAEAGLSGLKHEWVDAAVASTDQNARP